MARILFDVSIKFFNTEVVIGLHQVTAGRRRNIREGEMPVELVEFGGEGVGEDEVVVDELAIGTTRAIGDAPTQDLLGAGEDLADAMGVLEVNLISMRMVTETAGLDDGEEAPADLGFFLLGKFKGMTRAGKAWSSSDHKPSPTPVASMTMCCGCQVPARLLSLPKTERWFSPTQLWRSRT